MKYAQINSAGSCEGILNTPNAIDAAHMILLPEGSEVTHLWTYDGATWTAPPPPQPVLRRTDLTANDFFDLFTPTEQATFEVAIESVKALIASGGTPNAVQAGLLVVNRRISSVDFISLDDPRIASSLDVLVFAGIIQAGRKADIIAGVTPA